MGNPPDGMKICEERKTQPDRDSGKKAGRTVVLTMFDDERLLFHSGSAKSIKWKITMEERR